MAKRMKIVRYRQQQNYSALNVL